MKKTFSLALIFSFAMALTSCGYETLESPFKFIGDKDAVEKLGISSGSGSSSASTVQGFQVSIKAPAGTPMETAYSILNKEANRACRGGKYSYEITSQGEGDKMPANPQDTGNQKLPYINAIVVCEQNSPIMPTENVQTSNDLTREANSISAPIRANSMRTANNRGSTIQGRTMQTNEQLNVQDLLVPQQNVGY
ncbi:MAG: hypothetical protein SFT90_04755 [Rickettsiales bacterium]|nr:hypothetical protein [Rickettsiales bacterium]